MGSVWRTGTGTGTGTGTSTVRTNVSEGLDLCPNIQPDDVLKTRAPKEAIKQAYHAPAKYPRKEFESE